MHPRHVSGINIDSNSGEESEFFMEIRKSPVKCLCPKCGITHVLSFVWTGRGTPRKYCHRCRETVAAIGECTYESVHEISCVRRSAGLSIND